MMDFTFFHPQELFIIVLLIMLEIALSVDNLAGMKEKLARVPERTRSGIAMFASVSGLAVRLSLVLLLVEFTKLLDPYVAGTIFQSGRGMLLSLGGGFLMIKAVHDLRFHLSKEKDVLPEALQTNQTPTIFDIILFDAFLSIDSVIAALAMANSLKLVIVAMIIAHVLLNVFWKQIDHFFLSRPQMMTITFTFLLLIGLVSMVRILGLVLAEETLLSALIFAVSVELLNSRTLQAQPASNPKPSHGYAQRNERRSQNEQPQTACIEQNASAEPIDLFGGETCRNCLSTTFSAFPFCLSCNSSIVQQPVQHH